MRFASGFIVGVVMTVGAAFVVDTLHSAPGPDQRDARQMVNWGVVGDNMRELSTGMQTAWAWLVGSARKIERQTS